MKSIVSLEFTTDTIRAAEIAKPLSNKPMLVKFREVSVDPGIIGEDEIFDMEVAANAIRELWKLAKFSTKAVGLSVSNRKTIVREFEAPYVDLKQIKSTLSYEAADILPSQMEHSILDFYPIENLDHNGKILVKGLLVATQAEPLEVLVETITHAGLRTEFVDLATFGLARVGRALLPPDDEYILVNVNQLNSEAVVIKGGSPRLIRVIPNGIVVRDRVKRGKHTGAVPEPTLPNGTTNQVDSFLGSLRQTIAFYEGSSPDASVGKIYFTGEGSRSKELMEKVAAALSLPARVIELENIIKMPASAEGRDLILESSMIPVVAAGMRGVK